MLVGLLSAASATTLPGAVSEVTLTSTVASGDYHSNSQISLSGYWSAGDGAEGHFKVVPGPTGGISATAVSASNTISGLPVSPIALGWLVGEKLQGSRIAGETYITALTATSITFTNPATSGGSTTLAAVCPQNAGVFLRDAVGTCFRRTNIDGDLRHWGLTASSMYDANANLTDMNDAVGILQNATEVLASLGVVNFDAHGISTFWATSYVPSAATSLTCGAPSVTQVSNGYYVGLPGTIYLGHGASYKPVNNQDGIGHHWCQAVSEWYANPARVSQFSGISFNSPPLTYDDGEAMRANMALAADTAWNLRSVKGAQIDHVGCFGFDVCYDFQSSDHMNLSYMWGDGNVCMYGENGGGQSDSDHIDCEPFITKQANTSGATCNPTPQDSSNGICNEIYYSVTSISAAGTLNAFGELECAVTVGLATFNGHSTTGWPGTLLKSSATFSNGDALTYPAFMANFDPTVGAGKANALGCKRSGLPIVVTAQNSTSATFTLKGSAYSTGASKMSMVASWTAGPSAPSTATTQCATGCGVLRIVSGDALNVQPGMIVADNGSSGIPTGSVVVAVVRGCKGPDRYDGYIACVFISNPLTLSAVNATITFDAGTFTSEGTCDGAGEPTCVFFNSAERLFTGDSYVGDIIQTLPLSFGHHRGACYFSNGVAGWRQYSPFCYGHSYRWVFANSNNWLTTDAHDDDNGELDWLDVVDNYSLGSTLYGSAKGNGYGKASDTIVDDQYNLTQNQTFNTVASATVAGTVGSTISTVGSMAAWPNDGTVGTGKMTVAMCGSVGSGPDCKLAADLQYLTVQLSANQSLTVLACGQFYTACRGYSAGAAVFFVTVSSANDSLSFSTMTADTTDVGQNVLDVLHGSVALTDVQDKGIGRFVYVSPNANATTWTGFAAPQSDVLYDGTSALASLSGCGNTFAPASLTTSQQWQCTVAGQVTGSFTPNGATTATTLAAFGDRALSILDFNTGGHPAIPDCATSATQALSAAVTAAAAQGVHIIRLDGTAVGACYAIGAFTVPAGMLLYCPLPPQQEPVNNDYRGFAGISETSNTGITVSAGAKVFGCPAIRSVVQVAPPTGYQSNMTRLASYAGTAFTLAGDGASVEQSFIVGFNKCISIAGATEFTVHNVDMDCLTTASTSRQAGGGLGIFDGWTAAPYGTRAGTGGPVNTVTIAVSGVADNGSGELRLTHATCSTENCPANGDLFWVINATPFQSAQIVGGCMPHNVTATTVDCQGSTSGFLTGFTETGVVVTKGSDQITGLSSTHINQVNPGQAVTDGTTCIPAGTRIAYLVDSNGYNTIWMSDSSGNPVLATCSATENITLTDQATGTTSIAAAPVTAGNAGTGYVVGDHLQPTGGTVVSGQDADLIVQSVDGSGAVTSALAINDAGQYTVCPPAGSGVVDLTTPGATGAEFDFSCGIAIGLYANERTVTFSFSNVNEIKISNGLALSSAVGLDLGRKANGVAVDSTVSFHDQNANQDSNPCVIFENSSNQNTFSAGCYYAGGVLDESQASSSLAGNSVTNALVGGPPSSGLRRYIVRVVSSTPGTAKRTATWFSNNRATTHNGLAFVSDDSRGVHMDGNDFPFSFLRGQSTVTYRLVSGAANNFATGSMPVGPCPTNSPCIASSMQVVNLNTAPAPAPTTPSAIETVGSDAGTGQNIEGNAQAGTMAFQGIRRDSTLASPTAVAANEKDVSLSARAFDGSVVPATSEAGFQCATGENQTTSAHGHFCIVICTPNGSLITQECWRGDSVNTTSESLKFYGSAPAVTGTGSPTIVAGSTDSAGEVTGGTSATSIIITFNVAKSLAPFCSLSWQTPVTSFAYTISTTAINITQTATTGQKVDYVCVQH